MKMFNEIQNGISMGGAVISKKPYIVGLDIANSYVKLFWEKGVLCYPNTTKKLTNDQIDTMRGELEGKEIDTEDYVFTYTNEEGITNNYKVGGTMVGFTSSFTKSGALRYSSEGFRREFILSLARIAENGDSFAVVTGLPSSDYLDKDAREHIKSFIGKHEVGVNGTLITFFITDIFFETQARGTYMAATFGIQNGQIVINNQELANARYSLVVDIGFGTTDVVELTSNGKLMEDGLKGSKIAMSNVYSEFVANLKRKYRALDGMELIELENDLRDVLEKNISLYVGKDIIPYEEVYEELNRALSNTTNAVMEDLYGKVNFDNQNVVIFSGGGSLALKDYLIGKIDGKVRQIIVENPQIANSRGYYIRGMMIYLQGGIK